VIAVSSRRQVDRDLVAGLERSGRGTRGAPDAAPAGHTGPARGSSSGSGPRHRSPPWPRSCRGFQDDRGTDDRTTSGSDTRPATSASGPESASGVRLAAGGWRLKGCGWWLAAGGSRRADAVSRRRLATGHRGRLVRGFSPRALSSKVPPRAALISATHVTSARQIRSRGRRRGNDRT